jgi:hypothetical protein
MEIETVISPSVAAAGKLLLNLGTSYLVLRTAFLVLRTVFLDT